MFVIATTGPDNATEAVLPFVAGTGAASRDETVHMMFLQEATYLASDAHADLDAISAPGLPTVAEALGEIRAAGLMGEFVVCTPCAEPRGIDEDDLRDEFRFGAAEDMARLAAEENTLVF